MIRQKVKQLVYEVADLLCEEGLIRGYEIHEGHDIHAFYRASRDTQKVVHVQGYPGMSNDREARVYARLMDATKMVEVRAKSQCSIGNEHEAVIQQLPRFQAGVMVPYNPVFLRDRLITEVPEFMPEARPMAH